MKVVDAKEFWRQQHIQMKQECAGRDFGFGLNAQVFDGDKDDIGDERGAQKEDDIIHQHAANHARAMASMT